MAANDEMTEIRQLLQGATVRSVGRAADMSVVEFISLRGEAVNAHMQCPFRIVQQGTIIMGSRDMTYPQRGAGVEAFDQFKTIYDSRAATLNGILEQLRPAVAGVIFGDAGYVALEWDPGFRAEIFPDCSGTVEAWRVSVRGGLHYGFPQGSV
ncbi:hypothetical protein [Actinopolymorpha pittospori]|uniref:Uncharacterized protein n=1 Tax=Actinopolymorpha pittospori TaxID=648752 RepID=A0A927MT20_9ACTN|nr:hypothetical protein [Actinopolymorpha pittospori]MBE1605801.1 hypothetical protein [Actinopolymorpha pittospori]